MSLRRLWPSVLLAFLWFFPGVQPALLLAKHHKKASARAPHSPLPRNASACDVFVGSWVVDRDYPLYPSSDCPYIDPEFNCQLFGRPDSQYLKYRWQPSNCDLPRFDGQLFLSKMKGKSMMFVGDSLGLNEWQSLICMLNSAAPKARVQMSRRDPLSTFQFLVSLSPSSNYISALSVSSPLDFLPLELGIEKAEQIT
ncbi:trichome birefringence-like 43 protein [Nymphaea thermarum]|nr:trichome birefringence-like 43 protein [Nymphaea thermarum]